MKRGTATYRLNVTNSNLHRENDGLRRTNEKLAGENENLRMENKEYKLLRKTFESKQMDSLLEQAKAAQKSKIISRRRKADWHMGVTERLKAGNQILWVQKMNNIRACVREVVENEVIYS